MSEILESNLENKKPWEASKNALDEELLLKKRKEVPETLKKERASYEILGITNVLIDEKLKNVSFDYKGVSIDYGCKKRMDTITVSKKNGEDYTFEFVNSLFVENLQKHKVQKLETHNKNLIARLNICIYAQDKISKETPEWIEVVKEGKFQVRGVANKENEVYFIGEKNGEETFLKLQIWPKKEEIIGVSDEAYENIL